MISLKRERKVHKQGRSLEDLSTLRGLLLVEGGFLLSPYWYQGLSWLLYKHTSVIPRSRCGSPHFQVGRLAEAGLLSDRVTTKTALRFFPPFHNVLLPKSLLPRSRCSVNS